MYSLKVMLFVFCVFVAGGVFDGWRVGMLIEGIEVQWVGCAEPVGMEKVGGVVWLAVADWITCIRPIRLGLLLFHLNDKWDDVGK